MRSWWGRLLRDEAGSTGPEWAFVVSVLLLVAITGVVASRAVVLEPAAPPATEVKSGGDRPE